MNNLLVQIVILVLIAWLCYKFLPAPIGMIAGVIVGIVVLVKYIIPLL